MTKHAILAAFVATLVLGANALAAPPSGAVRWQPAAAVGVTTAAAPAVRAETEPAKEPILRILQRRKLGATMRNVRRILDEMKADGSYDDFVHTDDDGRTVVNVSALAVKIAGQLRAEKPGDWWDEIDWEALFALIERLITLIISLFG